MQDTGKTSNFGDKQKYLFDQKLVLEKLPFFKKVDLEEMMRNFHLTIYLFEGEEYKGKMRFFYVTDSLQDELSSEFKQLSLPNDEDGALEKLQEMQKIFNVEENIVKKYITPKINTGVKFRENKSYELKLFQQGDPFWDVWYPQNLLRLILSPRDISDVSGGSQPEAGKKQMEEIIKTLMNKLSDLDKLTESMLDKIGISNLKQLYQSNVTQKINVMNLVYYNHQGISQLNINWDVQSQGMSSSSSGKDKKLYPNQQTVTIGVTDILPDFIPYRPENLGNLMNSEIDKIMYWSPNNDGITIDTTYGEFDDKQF